MSDMKSTLLVGSVAILGLLSQAPIAHASANARLLRSPDQSAVYYSLEDGRRFAFPSQGIYSSWYPSFDQVETMPVTTLSQYRLAGVVMYRPGSMIKLTTDPKVYLVTANGELRWIETEAVAQSLFGTDWARHVQDVSDAFFFAYHVGNPIHAPDNVSLSTLLSDPHASTITDNQELAPGVAPTPTPTPTVTSTEDILLQTSASDGIRAGDSIQISTFAQSVRPNTITISINGTIAQTCSHQTTCGYLLSHPAQSTITSYIIRTDAMFPDGVQKSQSVTIPVLDRQAGALKLTTSTAESRPQGSVDIDAEWNDTVVRPYRMTILVNGAEQKICYNVLTCKFTYGIDQAAGSAVNIVGVVDDTSGQTWTSTSIVQVVANPRPIITASANSTAIHIGESATVNIQASDEDGIALTEIWQDGVRVAQCNHPSCTFTTAPVTHTGVIQFYVVAQDLRGARQEADIKPMIVLTPIN